jgi:DNA adenine methylase
MKWAGGKTRLLGHILPHLEGEARYFEPFVGGGAVFLALAKSRSIIADTNPEVTNCYKQIKANVESVIEGLGGLKNSEVEYYRVRQWEPRSPIERAVKTLYLTRLSFNGIYRQNLNGQFNVPYGHKTHLPVVDSLHLRKVSSMLRKVSIRQGDFEETTQDATTGDVVYFDPPYTVAHGNNGFVKYNSKIFSWEDQRRLACFASSLRDRGCKVVISNADHYSIDELYSSFERISIDRPSVIAASSDFRKRVTECVFVGHPK